MKNIGMARKVDDLGRIVLPVELRRLFGIRTGDELEISVDGETIILKKVQIGCALCGSLEGLTSYREKLVCTACVAELGAAVTTGAVVPAPPAGPVPSDEPSPSQSLGETA
jgi:AbrB family transcriptional regulator, transcriptional pleiotropic regulator of transition state genes